MTLTLIFEYLQHFEKYKLLAFLTMGIRVNGKIDHTNISTHVQLESVKKQNFSRTFGAKGYICII